MGLLGEGKQAHGVVSMCAMWGSVFYPSTASVLLVQQQVHRFHESNQLSVTTLKFCIDSDNGSDNGWASQPQFGMYIMITATA